MENDFQNTFDDSQSRSYRSGSARTFGPRGPRGRGYTQSSDPGTPGPGGLNSPIPSGSSPRHSTHSKESEPSSPTMSLSQFDSTTIFASSVTGRPESMAPRDDLELELPPPRPMTNSIKPRNEKAQAQPVMMPKTVEVVKPVMLKMPPNLNFDVAPITHKGLPLDAAQWTLTTDELQEIVSRAIRLSARESFIRVLPVDTVDNVLAQEAERLAGLRLAAQSKYRFQMHRRTMLLQSLVSCSTSKPVDGATVSALATQLAELTTSCDRIMEELVHSTDQQGQVKSMVELHWASALAIALRKLNKSYERKSMDLKEAKSRILRLEAELAEAWAEADKLATELDSLELSSQDDEGDEAPNNTYLPYAQVVEVRGRAVASEGKMLRSPAPPDETHFILNDHVLSLPEAQSTSVDIFGDCLLGNGPRQSRTEQIAAAKERSRRTSDAGLRNNRSVDHGRRPPPLPGIPSQVLEGNTMDSPTLGPDTPRPMPESRTSMQGISTKRQNVSEHTSHRYSVPSEASFGGDSYLEM